MAANGVITMSAGGSGKGGKPFVARIVGRDPKFTFAREFVGRNDGKTSTAMIDAAGLYQTRSIDKKGAAEDTYCVVWADESALRVDSISMEQAMTLARAIEQGETDFAAIGRQALIERLRGQYEAAATKDPGSQAFVSTETGALLGLDPLEKHAISTIQEARAALIARLEGGLPQVRVAADLAHDKAAHVAKVRALMAELGVTVADLG